MLKIAIGLACVTVMALASPCLADSAQADPVKAVQGIVDRWFPTHRNDFIFVQIPKDPGGDVFEIESMNGNIVISGNDGVALASGLNWYLKYYCNVNITYFASQTKMPETLPSVPSKIRHVSPYKYRYVFNYCMFGYSLPWQNWSQWQRMIDWMALSGINMPLAITGQEAVWREVYHKLGLSDRQINEFFTGPAFLPWGWMGCVDGFGGPLPESWYAKRVDLQKKVLERERSFGMTPVLQGFTGHVAIGIKQIFPKAQLHKLSWNGFQPTYFLDPLDPAFRKIGAMFIEEQTKMFGTDHFYASDTFVEMTPDRRDPEFLTEFGQSIYKSMSSVDPEAVWVLQDWFFAADPFEAYWKPEQAKALFASVPEGKLVVLDMAEFWKTRSAFYGQPWIHTYIQDFGGVVSLHGDTDARAEQFFTALHDPQRGNLQGLGCTDEGLNYNPHVMDFMTDAIWRTEKPDMEKWYSDYLHRRYGRQDADIDEAWKILRKTAFSNWRYDSMICALLAKGTGDAVSLMARGGPGYDNRELAHALELYLKAADRVGDTDTYRFDLLNIERQALANLADDYYKQVMATIDVRDVAGLDAAGSKMLALIDDLDRLTGTRRDYMLGPWVEDAGSWGASESEKRFYEWNSKNILTIWGPAQQGCYHYAQRQWSGLLKDYYRKRWEMYLKATRESTLFGKDLDEAAFWKQLRYWEDEWGHQDTKYPTKPKGDTIKIARELWAKYRTELTTYDSTKK